MFLMAPLMFFMKRVAVLMERLMFLMARRAILMVLMRARGQILRRKRDRKGACVETGYDGRVWRAFRALTVAFLPRVPCSEDGRVPVRSVG
jgi:hypothetical protein